MRTVSEPRYGKGITWRIRTFVDNAELAVLELPFRFERFGFVGVFPYVVLWVDHKTCHVVTGEAIVAVLVLW